MYDDNRMDHSRRRRRDHRHRGYLVVCPVATFKGVAEGLWAGVRLDGAAIG